MRQSFYLLQVLKAAAGVCCAGGLKQQKSGRTGLKARSPEPLMGRTSQRLRERESPSFKEKASKVDLPLVSATNTFMSDSLKLER